MKTRLLIFMASTLFAGSGLHAQEKISFGIRGGLNLTDIQSKSAGGPRVETALKPGFNAGFNAEIPLAESFFLQPGLLFSQKGARDAQGDGSSRISYLELPVNFLYKPQLGRGRLLLGFGPYLATGLSGTARYQDTETKIHFRKTFSDEDLTTGSNQPAIRRMDAGGNILLGYEFTRRFSLQLNGQLGMRNLTTRIAGFPDDSRGTFRNRGFGISAGYRF